MSRSGKQPKTGADRGGPTEKTEATGQDSVRSQTQSGLVRGAGRNWTPFRAVWIQRASQRSVFFQSVRWLVSPPFYGS